MEFLKEKGVTVTPAMTNPTRPGKQPRPVWEVTTLTHQYDKLIRDAGGKKWRGKFSFWEDPTQDLAELIKENNGNTYAEQREYQQDRATDRAERMTERAEKAQARSQAEYQRSNDAVSGIPFGQPILVGHHSERGHRNALKKSDRAMTRSIEEREKAEHYTQRAESAEKQASGQHSIAFIGRRIEDTNTEIRKLERNIQEAETKGHQDWLNRLKILLQEATEKLAYWNQELSKAGGVQYSPEDINKGDLINYRRYGWYEVVRANKKTVTIKGWLGVESMTWKAPYTEITGHKTPET